MHTTITPEQIKTLRARLGLTQEALAGMLHVSLGTVAKWEAGAWNPVGDRAVELRRLLADAPPAATIGETVATYDRAIAAWEAERAERLAAGEPASLADNVLRVLCTTRDGLRRVAAKEAR